MNREKKNSEAEPDISPGWQLARWAIPLAEPPIVVQAGVGRHGLSGPERYHLPGLWCLHFYGYDAALRLGQTVFPIQPGYASVIAPSSSIEYFYRGPSLHLFVHFRWREPESISAAADTQPIAAMLDLGADFPRFTDRLEQAIRSAGGPSHRLQARVWDLLCELAQRSEVAPTGEPAEHPAVQQAKAQIELRISEELSVASLAADAGVSVGYLSKLFQQSDGATVVEYIRARRMRRAEHLLRYSTLSVKAVAATVGIPDLHLFNKTVRREMGRSPRALRAGR
ncbi:MAG TPA: helix-turn-helix transcriptional regulator [Capsulimonadaceae bacterium]|nr:helix-turn-helix transcriptional regulator [Capsulimonadaceae bacterium]